MTSKKLNEITAFVNISPAKKECMIFDETIDKNKEEYEYDNVFVSFTETVPDVVTELLA